MIKKIAFVSHRSKDMEKDKHFWGELLGLKLANEYQGKWLEFETPDGKTIAVECMSPEGSGPTLALETDDIEAEVARLKGEGVKFMGEVQDNKVCKMAFAFDPSGNMVMLHEIAPDRA
ncbi:MAG: VOC family protein [Planctomycetota bacterium]|jgi:predicted enzyme related to lactoylglutathione lyase